MINKPFKVFICKDTARNTNILGAETIKELLNTGDTNTLGDGEIVILDKNMCVLTPGNTIADSDTIYVAEGTSLTYTVITEGTGTSITARKIKLSDPIKANNVKKYSGKAYSAKAEQVYTSAAITSLTPVAGRQYIVRIVYKDVLEHPGQFVQQYSYIATAADASAVDTFGANVVSTVMADPNIRITLAYVSGSDWFTATGKAIPSCTTSLNDINEFDMVNFEIYFNYVDSNGNQQEYVDFSTTTAINYGTGTWEQMRDLEKAAWGYEGVYNRREFPVILPDFNTVKSSTYHLINIEHVEPYKTPNMLYSETTQVKTIIAFLNGTNGDAQQAFVLSQLNPWMASTSEAFANVTAM